MIGQIAYHRESSRLNPTQVSPAHSDGGGYKDTALEIGQRELLEIPLKDAVVLGPIDRYKKYGRFPWRFVTHILLTVLTSMQVLFLVEGQVDYSYFTLQNFYQQYMTFDDETAETGGTIKLFNITQVQTMVNNTVQNYYNVNGSTSIGYSLDNFNNLNSSSGNVQPVLMYSTNEFDSNRNGTRFQVFNLTNEWLGPFSLYEDDPQQLQTLFESLIQFVLVFQVDMNMPDTKVNIRTCVTWQFKQIFQFIQRGTMHVQLETQRNSCQLKGMHLPNTKDGWLCILIMLLCMIQFLQTISQFLTLSKYMQNLQEDYVEKMEEILGVKRPDASGMNDNKVQDEKYEKFEKKNQRFVGQLGANDLKIQQLSSQRQYLDQQKKANNESSSSGSSKPKSDKSSSSSSTISWSSLSSKSDLNEGEIYRIIQRNYRLGKVSWEALSFSDKLALFDMWSFVSAIANLLSFFGSFFILTSNLFQYHESEHFIGFGCCLTWFSLTRFLANTQGYTVISRTFALAIPLVTKVMMGGIPVFFAFTLLGVCLFWPMRGYFDSVPNAAFSLFACMNGDSVGDIFTGTTLTRLVMGQVFTYIFTILGMCFIQNLNMICVEDSYLTAKYSKNMSWFLGEEQKPSQDQNQSDEKKPEDNGSNWNMMKLVFQAQGKQVPEWSSHSQAAEEEEKEEKPSQEKSTLVSIKNTLKKKVLQEVANQTQMKAKEQDVAQTRARSQSAVEVNQMFPMLQASDQQYQQQVSPETEYVKLEVLPGQMFKQTIKSITRYAKLQRFKTTDQIKKIKELVQELKPNDQFLVELDNAIDKEIASMETSLEQILAIQSNSQASADAKIKRSLFNII